MSQKETTEPIGRLDVRESPGGDLSKLAELARQAYEQKRTKDCLDLTRALLLIDPDHADAQRMRLTIQSEMHRDLDSARAFLRQAQSKEEFKEEPKESSELQGQPSQLELSEPVPLQPPRSRRPRRTRWLVGVSALVVAGVVVVSLPRFRTNSDAVEASLLAQGASEKPKQSLSENAVQQLEPVQPDRTTEVKTASLIAANASSASGAHIVSSPPPSPSNIASRASSPDTRPDAPVEDRPVNAASGKLAVSSPTTVDIYENNAYLGSAPVSLELSAGAHTLEYRHGSLRKSLTQMITSNETAKAMITFDVSVQINSKPWAEVFVDGAERKPLGQTPLSGVRVPIGSVLIFENPKFQAKKYRITGNETGIQVAFP